MGGPVASTEDERGDSLVCLLIRVADRKPSQSSSVVKDFQLGVEFFFLDRVALGCSFASIMVQTLQKQQSIPLNYSFQLTPRLFWIPSWLEPKVDVMEYRNICRQSICP